MYYESCIALLFVPLETSEIGFIELVISLERRETWSAFDAIKDKRSRIPIKVSQSGVRGSLPSS